MTRVLTRAIRYHPTARKRRATPDGCGKKVRARGQRERIAIGPGVLRDAAILVLDEALSSLDAENEAVIRLSSIT